MALKQYAQDYDGSYPDKDILGNSGVRAADDPESLPALLNPYVKGQQIFVCPSGRPELQALGNTYQISLSSAVLSNPDLQEGKNADVFSSGIVMLTKL